ncbi:transglutaminase-like domain-containing protein [Methanolobus profundi]|uniref:transglutaminase-like domain-containing protein n=1 Tax=Methanolobus profundi TaxID=487685 RepID=UPI0015A62260|nr:transglutaminase-like domain-containing protein [Methanolobus profundi]
MQNEKPSIDAYLNKTSESILLESSNDTEIVQNIIEWENGLGLQRFNSNETNLRITDDAGWYMYIQRANCGERATIFEEMANRTGLTYRRVSIDGHIDSSGDIDNHAWSEVFIEDIGWVVADSGFRLAPPQNNFAAYSNIWLFGPVYAFENESQNEDRTIDYILNTEEIVIKSTRNGETIPNCSIDISLNYNGTALKVVGYNIKLNTNESGICPVTLGAYEHVSYTINIRDEKTFYQYVGEEDITLNNSTKEIEVEVNDLKATTTLLFLLLLISIICLIYSLNKIFSNKKSDKKKHDIL